MVKMFLYNVHTPSKTFALVHKDGESQVSLVDRICKKAGLDGDGSTAVKEGKDSAGLLYEYEGEKWSLDDDDDLSILLSRFPPSSTPSVTLQLHPPNSSRHTHFAPPPPSYSTSSSMIKSKAQNSQKKSAMKSSTSTASVPSGPTSKDPIEKSVATLTNGDTGSSKDAAGKPGRELGGTNGKKPLPGGGKTAGRVVSLSVPTKEKDVKAAPKAMSVTSTASRRSKYGGDPNAEPLGIVKRRAWEEFHANNGVRTVVGTVGKVKDVRMLLKSGYTHVYISRNFAYKAGLVDKKYAMGAAGYTGLKILGNVPITVGSRTATHRVFINEEQHFEVILGREWVEKMGIKVDPIDKTLLHYMDTGEAVACDLVVLKNEKGEVIHVT